MDHRIKDEPRFADPHSKFRHYPNLQDLQSGVHTRFDMGRKLLGILAILGVTLSLSQGHTAHSFQHYHGPVEGPDTEVVWQDKHGHHHHDFAAHPKYEFAYGVEDHHTGDYHGQKEHRDGKDVVGEYTVKEPGGNTRTVKYHAGKHGFHAHVINSNGNDHSKGHGR